MLRVRGGAARSPSGWQGGYAVGAVEATDGACSRQWPDPGGRNHYDPAGEESVQARPAILKLCAARRTVKQNPGASSEWTMRRLRKDDSRCFGGAHSRNAFPGRRHTLHCPWTYLLLVNHIPSTGRRVSGPSLRAASPNRVSRLVGRLPESSKALPHNDIELSQGRVPHRSTGVSLLAENGRRDPLRCGHGDAPNENTNCAQMTSALIECGEGHEGGVLRSRGNHNDEIRIHKGGIRQGWHKGLPVAIPCCAHMLAMMSHPPRPAPGHGAVRRPGPLRWGYPYPNQRGGAFVLPEGDNRR